MESVTTAVSVTLAVSVTAVSVTAVSVTAVSVTAVSVTAAAVLVSVTWTVSVSLTVSCKVSR